MTAESKIVWILGAGFSRSLGAPLLADLLTRESHEFNNIAIDDVPWDKEMVTAILDLYESGAWGRPTKNLIERQWQHAEEFIERLDLLPDSPTHLTNLRRFWRKVGQKRSQSLDWLDLIHEWPKRARLTALRMLAAECSAFVVEAQKSPERWAPYVDWARKLNANDTVITFNYDLVPNQLSKDPGAPEGWPGIWVPRPEEVSRPEDNALKACVLKLHGSVDWKMTAQGIKQGAATEAVFCDDARNYAIATPGPTKRRMIDGEVEFDGKKVWQPLKPLWNAAAERIRDANAFIFVGYSFPPTDAYTRKWFFDQLRGNAYFTSKKNHLSLFTVLGPNVAASDAPRLAGMLETAGAPPTGIARTRMCPVWAEDFIGLFDRSRLSSRES